MGVTWIGNADRVELWVRLREELARDRGPDRAPLDALAEDLKAVGLKLLVGLGEPTFPVFEIVHGAQVLVRGSELDYGTCPEAYVRRLRESLARKGYELPKHPHQK